MSKVNMSKTVTASFCAGTYTIRSVGGSHVAGRWVEGTPTERQVKGSFQKATAKDLIQVGLGEMTEETRKLLAPDSEVIKISEGDDTGSDRLITAGGKRYKAVKIGDNDEFGFTRTFFVFEGNE